MCQDGWQQSTSQNKNGLSLWHAPNLLRKCARLARSQAITVSAICGPAGLNDFFASKNCFGLRSPILILIQIEYPMIIYEIENTELIQLKTIRTELTKCINNNHPPQQSKPIILCKVHPVISWNII